MFFLSLSRFLSVDCVRSLSLFFSVRHVGRCLVCAHFDCACFFLICFAGHFFPKGNWQLPHRHFEGKLEKNVPLTSTDDFRNKNNHKRPAYLVGHDNQLKKALHQNLHSTVTVCERFFCSPPRLFSHLIHINTIKCHYNNGIYYTTKLLISYFW